MRGYKRPLSVVNVSRLLAWAATTSTPVELTWPHCSLKLLLSSKGNNRPLLDFTLAHQSLNGHVCWLLPTLRYGVSAL